MALFHFIPLYDWADWVVFHCIYMPHLLYLVILWWTLRSIPRPGYCKQRSWHLNPHPASLMTLPPPSHNLPSLGRASGSIFNALLANFPDPWIVFPSATSDVSAQSLQNVTGRCSHSPGNNLPVCLHSCPFPTLWEGHRLCTKLSLTWEAKENRRRGHVHFIRTKQIVAINIPSPVKLQASLKISVCFLMYLY